MAEGARYRVAVNLAASMVTQVVNKLFPLVAYAYAQRVLGIVAFGHALFAMTLVDMSTPFVDAGTSAYGQIVVGRGKADPRRMQELLGELLTMRLLNMVVVGLALVLWVSWKYPAYEATALAISFMLVTTALDATYVQTGTQRLWALSLFNAGSKIVILGCILRSVESRDDGTMFAILLVASNSILSLGTLIDAANRWRPRLPAWARLASTYRGVLPFAVVMVLFYALDKFDYFLVEAYLSPTDVGYYGGINRVFLSLQALIPALAVAFGAEMLSLAHPEPFARQSEAACFVLGLVICPLVVGAWFAGGPLLAKIYDPTFAAHAATFAVLCLSFLPHAVFIVVGMQALAIRGFLRQLAVAIGAGLAVGAAAGCMLVPALGMLGGALAVVLAKGVVAAMVLPRGRYLMDLRRAAGLAAPAFAGAAVMGLGLFLLRPDGLWPTLAWGTGLYGGACALLLRGRLKSLLG